MKKIALFVLLALAASVLMAAIPADISYPDGDGHADAGIVLLGKKPGMCYDPIFKVWYECVGRGLKNKYPWLSDTELQKKAEKLWVEAELEGASGCKRIWDILPGGYVIYSCKWKDYMPTLHDFKYYY